MKNTLTTLDNFSNTLKSAQAEVQKNSAECAKLAKEMDAKLAKKKAPTKEGASTGTPVIIDIYNFKIEDGYIKIFFNELSGKCRSGMHAKAHPALQVKPHMHQNLNAIIDYEADDGYKLCYPIPTVEQRIAYKQAPVRQPEPAKVALTAEQMDAYAEF